jgi:hypothetical protein
MINDKRSGILLGCGFLLMLLGSMPMNGFFLYLLWPNEFHKDPSTGSVPFLYLWLLVGLILWLFGIVLISLGTKKAWLVLMIGLYQSYSELARFRYGAAQTVFISSTSRTA